MKKKLLIAGMLGLTMLGTMNTVSAGQYVWGDEFFQSASTGNDIARDVAVIDNTLERKIVVGSYQPGAAGTYDGFIRCYNQSNDPLWYIEVEGSGNDEVNGVDCLAKTIGSLDYGDIYVTGYFTGTMTMELHYGFPAGHHFTTTLYTGSAPSGLSYDCTYFVSKFNQDGGHVWTQVSGHATEANTEIGNDVDVNLISGIPQVYTTGFFRGNCSFYSGTTPGSPLSSSASWNSVFVTKYADVGSSATVSWVRQINDNANNQHDYGYGVVGDENGNVYATGSFGGTTTVGVTPYNVEGNDDAFVVKYNTTGTVQWFKDFGGNGTVMTPSDQGRGIDYHDGALYVCGYYNGSGDFVAWSSSQDAFIVKIDAATAGWGWRHMIKNGTGADAGYRCAVSEDGNSVYVAGSMTGDANIHLNSIWSPEIIPSVSSGAYANGFLVSFATNPIVPADYFIDWEWLGDDNNSSVTTGVACLSGTEVYTCGAFKSYQLYDQHYNVMLTNSNMGTNDAYITLYDPTVMPRYAAPQQDESQLMGTAKLNVKAWPNPASENVNISIEHNGIANIEVLDLSGRPVLNSQQMGGAQINIDLSSLESGVYLVRVTEGKSSETIRIIKQ